MSLLHHFHYKNPAFLDAPGTVQYVLHVLQVHLHPGSSLPIDMRFTFIEKICEKTVVKPKESKERIRSEKIVAI